MMLFNPKIIFCLHKRTIKNNPIFLLYIYQSKKDEKPVHAFYVKELMISIEGTKILCLKMFNAVLKYEAESAIHAQDWLSAINKYKNPQSYERPLNLKKDSLTLDHVEMSEKPGELLQKQFPPPPDNFPN